MQKSSAGRKKVPPTPGNQHPIRGRNSPPPISPIGAQGDSLGQRRQCSRKNAPDQTERLVLGLSPLAPLGRPEFRHKTPRHGPYQPGAQKPTKSLPLSALCTKIHRPIPQTPSKTNQTVAYMDAHKPTVLFLIHSSASLPTFMNRAIITAIAVMLVVAATLANEPPANMQQHFKWCASAKTASDSITRYEGFWRIYLPAEEGGVPKPAGGGYGDAAHIMHVRLCAYYLLKLHIEAGNKNKSEYYAKWLEATDPVIGARPTQIPKQQPK
jgi:hypothetical protein